MVIRILTRAHSMLTFRWFPVLIAFTLIPALARDCRAQAVIDSFVISSASKALWVKGGYAFIAAYDIDFLSYDVSDPYNIRLADRITLGNMNEHLFISGDYAYISDWYGGLYIVDITNPGDMTCVGNFDPADAGEYVHSSYVEGKYAYLAVCHRMLIVNVSYPANPVLVSAIIVRTGDGRGIWKDGFYAYMTDEMSRGFSVIDVTNVNDPILRCHNDSLPSPAMNPASRSGYVYVPICRTDEGIVVVDANNPDSAEIVYSCEGVTNGKNVFCLGNYMFAASSDSGLNVYNILDPGHPQLEWRFMRRGCQDVFVDSRYTYVITANMGQSSWLYILDFQATAVDEEEAPLPDQTIILSAYPNPFNAAATITVEGSDKAEISIFDITGRKVAALHAENGHAVWDASGQSSGVYFVRAMGEGAKGQTGRSAAQASNVIKLLYLK